jgi:inorganic pyrophosphatase/exopolyphosphatase
MRAAPRAAPFATVSSVSKKRNPRVGATTRPMAASSETSGQFVTVDETAVADLNAFLRDTRTLLRGGDSKTKQKKQKKRLTLVLGNEAADLDSVACAVSLAYSLHLANDDETRAYAPVVCVPREDFPLRADARWLLDHVGIDVDALTFDGEIPFGAFARTTRDDALRLVLVDHNAVASSSAYAAFADAVDAVVDHHDDEKKYPAACDAVIVPTGSCATLVAEALVSPADASEPSGTATRVSFETAARLFVGDSKTGEDSDARRLRVGDPRAALLLAAVLLDTQNLNASATRVHARDAAIVPILASLAGTGDVAAFHDELKRRRFDQFGLSPRDLLRRDYKQWRFVPRATEDAPATSATSAWDVGVASFGVPLGEMATDARAIRDACAAFGRDKRVDALALMCAFDDETTYATSAFRRQFAIAFFDADAEGKGASLSAPPRDDALVALSARMFEPGGVLPVALGGLEPVADATALDAFGGFAFEQGDPTRSRKKAQPALAAFFEGAPPPRAAAARAGDGPVDDGD